MVGQNFPVITLQKPMNNVKNIDDILYMLVMQADHILIFRTDISLTNSRQSRNIFYWKKKVKNSATFLIGEVAALVPVYESVNVLYLIY
jgi:hypothetical protein